jgi:signal transduction histidine kinase
VTFATKIRVLVVVMALAPFLLLAVSLYAFTMFSRDHSAFRRMVEWNQWVERELIGGVRTGSLPRFDHELLGEAIILDENQHIIASSDPEAYPEGETLRSLIKTRVLTDSDRRVRSVIRIVDTDSGERRHVVYTQPELRVPPPSPDPRRLMPAVIAVLVLLGGGAAGAMIVRDFSHALISLQGVTHRIAGGDLSTPVRTDRTDEFAALAHDLERMRGIMEENRQRRGRMLMGISHDLGTPLTTIMGYVEALQDGVFTEEKSRERSLSAIATKATLLQDRIEQLVEFARLDSESWSTPLETIGAARYFNEVGRSMVADASLTGRTVEYRIGIGPEQRIEIHRGLMDRVFENLFQNAVRYTRPGDTIRMTVEEDQDTLPDTLPDGRRGFVVRFEDSGPGFGSIPPEELFEPFRRGSHGRNEPGTGFGLTTVRAILENHGFTVSAEASCLGGAAVVIRGRYAGPHRVQTGIFEQDKTTAARERPGYNFLV